MYNAIFLREDATWVQQNAFILQLTIEDMVCSEPPSNPKKKDLRHFFEWDSYKLYWNLLKDWTTERKYQNGLKTGTCFKYILSVDPLQAIQNEDDSDSHWYWSLYCFIVMYIHWS